MKKLSPLALALALAFPLGAQAQSNADLKKEIEMLKSQLAELKQMVTKQAAAKPVVAAPAASVDTALRAEVAAMRVKMDAMEDAKSEAGFEGLKISGFADPTYIYNKNTGRGDFLFLNDVGGDTNDLASDAFGYPNSNFGGVTIKLEKTFENGMLAMVALRPHKSGSGTMVEEALLTLPVSEGVNAIVGKQISWNGYEYVNAPDFKNVTHNLLYDFGGPYYMVGAGLTFSALDAEWKTMVGNMNSQRDLPGAGNQNRGFHWRADWEASEFFGYGASGLHGTLSGKRYNYAEADFWYTRGDWTFNGQVEGSSHKEFGFNGGKASHVGVSGLAAYNLGDGWEAIVRADWLDDSKNGGSNYRSGWDCSGLGGVTGADDDGDGVYDAVGADNCGDYRNGWGPALVMADPLGLGTSVMVVDGSRGPKRTALTFGLNYLINENALLKLELRHDRSDLESFYDFSSGTFKKSNTTIGAQTVVKF